MQASDVVAPKVGTLATNVYSVGSMKESKNHKLQGDCSQKCEKFKVMSIVQKDFVVVKEGEPLWM